jgi:hypothetical protein
LEKNHRVFQEIHKGIPPYRDHEHQIELIPRITPNNKRPYRYPHQKKGDIEKMVQYMLCSGITQPRKTLFLALVVMVRKNDNSWRLCPDCRDINKITIKDKFHIPNIYELLDEIHEVAYYTNLYLKSISD